MVPPRPLSLSFTSTPLADRRPWKRTLIANPTVRSLPPHTPVPSFINKELVLFSMADNQRSIPSLLDGFKPSQRKVLFACFKRKLKVRVKPKINNVMKTDAGPETPGSQLNESDF